MRSGQRTGGCTPTHAFVHGKTESQRFISFSLATYFFTTSLQLECRSIGSMRVNNAIHTALPPNDSSPTQNNTQVLLHTTQVPHRPWQPQIPPNRRFPPQTPRLAMVIGRRTPRPVTKQATPPSGTSSYTPYPYTGKPASPGPKEPRPQTPCAARCERWG